MNAEQNRRLAVWLLAPAITFVIVVGAFPVLSQLVLSFTEYNLKFAEERGFVGLGNFARLATDAVFWRDLWHTTYFTVISVGLELVLGLSAQRGSDLGMEGFARGGCRHSILQYRWS